jgi:alpha-mannosidase
VLPTGADFAAPFELHGEVVFSCLKGAEDGDGVVLRMFNPGSAPATVRVDGGGGVNGARGGVEAVERLRLDETALAPLDGGDFAVAPGEIATVRLRRG